MAVSNRYQATNVFSGGMNSDADKSVLSNNQFVYSENFRLFGDSLNSVGALEVISGTTALSSLNTVIGSGYYVVGSCSIRDEVYIAITQNTAAGQTGTSKLIKCTLSSDGKDLSTPTVIYNDSLSSDGSRLLWNNLPQYRLKMVGRYESDTIKKIYFVDAYNIFRCINTVTVSSTSPVNKFDVIPNFNLSAPVFRAFGSGRLTSGKIQYAYQMYDLNGAETLFSPASPLISISSTSGQSGSNKTFKGSDVDVNTGKGISFSIYPPSGFTRIRIVSIKYDSLSDIPTISIVADQNIGTSPGTTYFYDTGVSNLGSYTYEEFALVGRNVFVGSEIEDKNNYLFIGNITDQSWDVTFDARAYRFVSSSATGTLTSGHAAIFDSGTWGSNGWYDIYSNCLINGTTEVPETYDCWNPYNDISLDTQNRRSNSPPYVHLYPLIYQSNGTTIGGTGKYVSYYFNQGNEIVISDTGSTYNEDYCYNADYSNASIEIAYTGYQRDEVYRFGIIFFDAKGRRSSVKWIGDIRFPWYGDAYTPDEQYEHGPSDWAPHFTYSSKTYARPLGLIFNVNTESAYSQGARYFKIVRAERKSNDRNILAQGVTPTTILYNDGSGLSYRQFVTPYTGTSTVGGITKERTVVEFISPEINFNKNLGYLSGDTIEYIGKSSNHYQWDNVSNISVTVGTLPSDTNPSFVMKYSGFSTYATAYRYARISAINSSLIFGPPTKVVNTTYQDGVNMSGVTYKVMNFIETTMSGSGSSSHFGPAGTKNIMKIAYSGLTTEMIYSGYSAFYCNYKRNVFNSQYGGNTYSARKFTTYIDTGTLKTCYYSGQLYPYIQVQNVYGGDTYIGMFDYLRNIITGDVPSNRRTQNVMYIPVETSINLRYRHDDCFSKTVDDATHSRMLMQELAGTYTSGSLSYTQTTNLYLYNSVYSQQNSSITFYPLSTDSIVTTEIHDNRILVSDLKTDGELSDSWTMFRTDNFLDVDSKYGKLTNLLHKDDYLYFWQPNAFGVLSVNQRSVLSDNNPGALVLGTGGVLDRYDYISTTTGCNYRFSIIDGLNGIYWIDNTNQVIVKYGEGGVNYLSKSKGVSEYIRPYISLGLEGNCTFDKLHNEVLISPSASYTLVNNEIFDSFVGVQTFIPTLYLKVDGSAYVFSAKRSGGRDSVYSHGTGSKGSFYGSVYPSMVRFVVNDKYNSTKVFDMFQYESSCRTSAGINQLYTTFDTIRVYDDYQNSDYTNITLNSNLTRKEREFNLIIPRNVISSNPSTNPDIFDVDGNGDPSRLFRERMRDRYITVELTYNNSSNYVFSVPYVTTNYRISKR